MLRTLAVLFAAVATLALGGCGYNDLQPQDEQIKAPGARSSTSTSAARISCPTSSTR